MRVHGIGDWDIYGNITAELGIFSILLPKYNIDWSIQFKFILNDTFYNLLCLSFKGSIKKSLDMFLTFSVFFFSFVSYFRRKYDFIIDR